MEKDNLLQIAKEFKKSYVAIILLVLMFGPFGLFYASITYGIILSIVNIIAMMYLIPQALGDLLRTIANVASTGDIANIIHTILNYSYLNGKMLFLIIVYILINIVSLSVGIYYVFLYNKNTYSLVLSLNEYKNLFNGRETNVKNIKQN